MNLAPLSIPIIHRTHFSVTLFEVSIFQILHYCTNSYNETTKQGQMWKRKIIRLWRISCSIKHNIKNGIQATRINPYKKIKSGQEHANQCMGYLTICNRWQSLVFDKQLQSYLLGPFLSLHVNAQLEPSLLRGSEPRVKYPPHPKPPHCIANKGEKVYWNWSENEVKTPVIPRITSNAGSEGFNRLVH